MKPMRRDYDNTDYCRRLHALFKPGNGVSPPVLAGREGELDTLSKRLDLLVCRDEVASDVVLYGPRGNGKTVLLRELERLAERAGADTLTLRPTQVPSALDLAKQLLYNDHDALGDLLGRLTPDATAQALARPLADKGVEFDPDALGAVVEDCQGYPYVTQVWGQALCEALVERRAPRISLDIVTRARPGVDREREDYYQDRYIEMENNDLLAAAMVVGDVYARANERVDSQTLRAALVAAGAASAESVAKAQVRQLATLGYLWRQPPGVDWEPGIPSLMRYVNEKTARFAPDGEAGSAPPSGMSP
ncbi:MAG: ATP-binding protein [Gammaproteobacteria bacterium]|nr:ATP-binding protein [Gammaproteobacteria bacterium]